MNEVLIAGVVAITMALMEGLFGLVRFIVNKYSIAQETIYEKKIEDKLVIIAERLDDTADDAKKLVDMHSMYDGDGTPIWYVPRSWADTQKEVVDKLQVITLTMHKMLVIIERLEKRLDTVG